MNFQSHRHLRESKKNIRETPQFSHKGTTNNTGETDSHHTLRQEQYDFPNAHAHEHTHTHKLYDTRVGCFFFLTITVFPSVYNPSFIHILD